MIPRVTTSVASMLLIAGCAATSAAPNLNAAAAKATDAAVVVHRVQGEILEARLLGLVEQESLMPSKWVPAALACRAPPSVELTAKELGAYADAINTVGKVAAKPKDVSYGGYLQQFKKNRAAESAAAETPEEESAKDRQETLAREQRCMTLLSQDVQARLTGPGVAGANLAIAALPAALASIDGLIRAVLGVIEQAQRDVAVRKAAQHMVVVLKQATAKLSEPPDSADYRLAGESTSRLGNALAIHRWFAAQRLQADWDRLHDVNREKQTWLLWEAADRFVADAQSYETLSANDPDKLLQQLRAALEQASIIDDKTTIGAIFDTLGNMAAALAGVDDGYRKFRKTID
jgi:hypothetical protein